MTWFFFEKQNRELRTIPSGFGSMRINNIAWAQDWTGVTIQPGTQLAVVSFADGAQPQVYLTAPPGCQGLVGGVRDIEYPMQADAPSQLLLYLNP